MSNKSRVCVLGAGGAIGSQLVRHLLSKGYQVTTVVRRLSSAVRIGRYDINIVQADLLECSTEKLVDILDDHCALIDCTYSTDSDYDTRISQSTHLANLICDAAEKANVERLIHLGTISVYPVNAGDVSEETICIPRGDAYADAKLAAEKVMLSRPTKIRSVVVLQLPVVYGPFMMWTTAPVQQMLGATYTMPDDLRGRCTPIYVDDVATAVALALEINKTGAEKILLSGPEALNWGDFYREFSKLSEDLKLNFVSRDQLNKLVEQGERQARPLNALKEKFSNDGDFRQLVLAQFGIRTVYRWLKRRRGQEGMDVIKARIANQIDTPSDLAVRLISQHTIHTYDTMPAIRSDKASRLLGFNAEISFADGVKQCGDWLRWARILK